MTRWCLYNVRIQEALNLCWYVEKGRETVCVCVCVCVCYLPNCCIYYREVCNILKGVMFYSVKLNSVQWIRERLSKRQTPSQRHRDGWSGYKPSANDIYIYQDSWSPENGSSNGLHIDSYLRERARIAFEDGMDQIAPRPDCIPALLCLMLVTGEVLLQEYRPTRGATGLLW